MLQSEYFILSGTSRKAFMSSTLRISICIKRHLSINVRSAMTFNCRTTSWCVWLASWCCRIGHSAIGLSCSFPYSIAVRITSTLSAVCPPRFRLDPLETYLPSLTWAVLVPINSSGDMFYQWLYIGWKSIFDTASAVNASYPTGLFDLTSAKVSTGLPSHDLCQTCTTVRHSGETTY